MVPETHEIEFPTSEKLRTFLTSDEFRNDTAQKLKDQYVVEVSVNDPKQEKQDGRDVTLERLVLSYTRNNAGGLKDAIDFLLLPLMARDLDQNNVKGAIPRPKSDSFEDNMLYFESRLLQRAEPPMSAESPTRSTFGEDSGSRSIFDKLRKPGSMSSFSSFIERRRKNGTNSPGSLFMQTSNNASKASLVSMESRDSGYRNPWNDSGIDLEHDQQNGHTHANSWGSFGGSSRPNTSNSLSGAYEAKFPFGVNGNASTSSLNTPMIPGLGMVNGSTTTTAAAAATTTTTTTTTNNGDVTPKYEAQARSVDGGDRKGSPPSTDVASQQTTSRSAETAASTTYASASSKNPTSGYPAPIGPPH